MKTTTTKNPDASTAAESVPACTQPSSEVATALYDGRLGVPEHLAGIFAEDQLKAEGILEFACPTQGADGNMVAQRLREVGGPPVEYLVRELEELHTHIKARDRQSNDPSSATPDVRREPR